jgi:hypothetical protein
MIMKTSKSFLAAAVLATALALTLSCAGSKPTAHTPGAYVETEGGFAVVPPDGWKVVDNPNSDYKVFMESMFPGAGNFIPNVNFVIEPYNRPLDDYIEYSINQLKSELNATIIRQQDFKTAKGLNGKKIITTLEREKSLYRMLFYVFPNKEGYYMIATAASLASSGEKYDAAFDKSMKTFEWIEKTAQAEPQTGTYIDQAGGFRIEAPDTWLIIQQRNVESKTLISPHESDSSANLNFAVRESNRNISEYLDANIAEFQTLFSQNNFQSSNQEDFTTAKGLKGKKATATMEANGTQLKLFLYVIPKPGKGIYLFANGTSILSQSDKLESSFDESMRTFEWME